MKIIPRNDHILSRNHISANALKVLYRLHKAGYQAYLVGGGVRDLLLKHNPKDFDVVTDARPEEVKKLFRNCRLIGRRFRLAHVYFGWEDIIEVATFRGKDDELVSVSEHGMILRDNVYGTLSDDVWRRDFTVNALYYNIADFTVVDYVGGVDDLQHKIVRMIGNPEERFREDPIRMIRAIRFAAKLGFQIEQQAEQAIEAMHDLILHVPPARLFEELQKCFLHGYAYETFLLLCKYGIFERLFPQTELTAKTKKLLAVALNNADERVQEGKSLSPAFIYVVLLWAPMQQLQQEFMAEGMKKFTALHQAIEAVIRLQVKTVAIPKRHTQVIKEIFMLQYWLQQRRGRKAYRCFHHPRFRAGYDFMLLRQQAGEKLKKLCDWWTTFQQADDDGRIKLIKKIK